MDDKRGIESESPDLSEAERFLLELLWTEGASTVRELLPLIEQRGRRWAYTTAATLLNRLKAKGFVETDDGPGNALVFRPARSRQDVLRDQVRALADRFGERSPSALVLSLVEPGTFNRHELQRLKQLLERLDDSQPEEGAS